MVSAFPIDETVSCGGLLVISTVRDKVVEGCDTNVVSLFPIVETASWGGLLVISMVEEEIVEG